MPSQQQKAAAFKAMHRAPRGFVMPNAWDAGSAIILAEAGVAAIATTSAGIAFSMGRPDYNVRDARLAVPRAAMFERMREIVEAVPLPVNGDLEEGYGDRPEDVAETVRLAIEAGLAGGNIEDRSPRIEGLFDEQLAADRIRAARAAIDAAGSDFVLCGRTDAFQVPGEDALKSGIRRARLFREAGADCVYPPGIADLLAIRTFVKECGAPVNIVTGLRTALPVADLLDAGVARVSLGGAIARAALGFVQRSVRELAELGTLGFAAGQLPGRELNALFSRARQT
ncbi:MAG: isocitrate lyase/phosphoenolpyruvate mutase family protein [Alphaproteobacteria bacterium]|nr:isocitrate lyase/phosphoenolpyruvate mutase family protein [Alphaproteobacteria bacterium]MCW5738909.1 isocitrate lyase/phosphoenolpyruvate mutase family protein [Alphaproteobacteria bacterium]